MFDPEEVISDPETIIVNQFVSDGDGGLLQLFYKDNMMVQLTTDAAKTLAVALLAAAIAVDASSNLIAKLVQLGYDEELAVHIATSGDVEGRELTTTKPN